MIKLEVPAPPSVNRIWRRAKNHDGEYRSPKYMDWLGHAGWVLRSQSPGRIEGHVIVLVSVERVGGKGADIDNRIKALFDLLVAEKVIEDDRFIVGFAAAWAPRANGIARLMIVPASSFDARFILAADGRCGGWFSQAHEDDEYAYQEPELVA